MNGCLSEDAEMRGTCGGGDQAASPFVILKVPRASARAGLRKADFKTP